MTAPDLSRGELARRVAAEFVGTGLLVAVAVGSGIAAQTLSVDNGLRLLENALATAGGLAVLILVLGPVSGAHFNPVVSLADWWLGRASRSGPTGRQLGVYLPAQCAGGICGAILANALYAEPLVSWSQHQRTGANLLLSEVVAPAGWSYSSSPSSAARARSRCFADVPERHRPNPRRRHLERDSRSATVGPRVSDRSRVRGRCRRRTG